MERGLEGMYGNRLQSAGEPFAQFVTMAKNSVKNEKIFFVIFRNLYFFNKKSPKRLEKIGICDKIQSNSSLLKRGIMRS